MYADTLKNKSQKTIMSDSRDTYYTSRPNSEILQTLAHKIKGHECTGKAIIKDIIMDSINVNAYVQLRKGAWVPLVQLVSMYPQYTELVRFLLSNGADPTKLPDMDKVEPIIYTCDRKYLGYLCTKSKCKSSNTQYNITKRLRCGDVDRLRDLLKLNVITVEDFAISERTLKDVTQATVNYFFYAFNMKDITDKTQEIADTLSLCLKSIDLLLELGAAVTEDYLSYCCEYYLYEILQDLINRGVSVQSYTQKVPCHTSMNAAFVAMLRPLLNDKRYEETCKVMKQKPESHIYKSFLI